jgi:hypothetical protein
MNYTAKAPGVERSKKVFAIKVADHRLFSQGIQSGTANRNKYMIALQTVVMLYTMTIVWLPILR